jgi:hypothetical protein
MAFWEALTNQAGKIAPLLAGLLVCPPWVWLAVRTTQSLRVITRNAIPLSKRRIWLTKMLALIIGAGNVAGVLIALGASKFLALIPAAIIVLLSLREDVSEVVPPKPPLQDATAYHAAWRQYERLRASYRRSGLSFVAVFVSIILVGVLARRLPEYAQVSLYAVCFVVLLLSIGAMGVTQWKWVRWRCPRCGCSFRGEWGRLWLPKKCVYCGLPRYEGGASMSSSSRNVVG